MPLQFNRLRNTATKGLIEYGHVKQPGNSSTLEGGSEYTFPGTGHKYITFQVIFAPSGVHLPKSIFDATLTFCNAVHQVK